MPGTRHDYFDDADGEGEYGEEDEDLEQGLLGEELVHDGRTPVSTTGFALERGFGTNDERPVG